MVVCRNFPGQTKECNIKIRDSPPHVIHDGKGIKNTITKNAIALLLQYMLGRVSKRTQKTGQHGRQDCLYESTVKVRDGMADHDLVALEVEKGHRARKRVCELICWAKSCLDPPLDVRWAEPAAPL